MKGLFVTLCDLARAWQRTDQIFTFLRALEIQMAANQAASQNAAKDAASKLEEYIEKYSPLAAFHISEELIVRTPPGFIILIAIRTMNMNTVTLFFPNNC